MNNEPGFKRLWRAPRRMSGGGLLDAPTARQLYLREQSQARYLRRPDAYPIEGQLITGEIGMIESFRFIVSPYKVDMARRPMLAEPEKPCAKPSDLFLILMHRL